MKTILITAMTLVLSIGLCSATCPLVVHITAGPGDCSIGCGTVTYTAVASGGTPPYNYVWTYSTGDGGSGTGSTVNPTPATKGPGVATVTVTDANSATAQDTRNYTIHNQVETTGTVGTGGTPTTWPQPPKAVSANIVGPGSLKYTESGAATTLVGITVTGTVDEGLVKTAVAGTESRSFTSTASVDYGPFPVPAGETAYLGWSAYVIEYTGTWNSYPCTGPAQNGTWTDLEPDTSKNSLGVFQLVPVS